MTDEKDLLNVYKKDSAETTRREAPRNGAQTAMIKGSATLLSTFEDVSSMESALQFLRGPLLGGVGENEVGDVRLCRPNGHRQALLDHRDAPDQMVSC